MKKKFVRVFAAMTAILAVCIGSNASARADLLSIPMMLPDLCAFGQCVQFTQTAALASVQQVVSDMQMLKNMEEELAHIRINAQTIRGLWPQFQGDISSLKTAYKKTFPGTSAVAVADQYTDEMNADQQYLDELSPLADTADGSMQQAQLTNRYLAQLDGDIRKTGALTAAQIKQHADENMGNAVGVFGILNSATLNGEPDF